MARVELILRQSGSTDQLDADLLIYDEHGYPSQVVDCLSPMPAALSQSINDWQGTFANLVGARRGIKVVSVASGSCADRTEEVREAFATWLTSQASWQRLQNCINQSVASHEEVQINIQTLDKQLRLLPWNEIFLEHHRYAETSISLARQFQRRSNLQPQKQVRILAVLGSSGDVDLGSSGNPNPAIDVDFDHQQLEKTRARGAYIQTIKQPTVKELQAALRDPKGWHIFFFAGHSQSQQNNTIGSILLNQAESPLAIDELKAELAIAIEHGLQIAIFNSCDGLGLANQLAELNLPQSIVMREPVPDEVAKDFLQQFLAEFSHNKSLFESVRRARVYLRQKFDRQSAYPGASWLPTIVRNPAVSLPQWNDFITESPLSWQWLLPLSAVAGASLVSLILCLYVEFNGIQVGSTPKFIYYAQLYPHLALYPWIFLWGAYFTLYKAWCQIRSTPKLWRQLVGVIGIGVLLLSVELTQDNLMLFELKEGAESAVPLEQIQLGVVDKIINAPASIINTKKLIHEDNGQKFLTIRKADLEDALERFRETEKMLSDHEKTGYHEFMKLGLAYKTWQGRGAFSISRIFYALTFLNIIMVVLASAIFWKEMGSRYVYNGVKYIRYVIATQIIVLLWVPIRVHNNLVTKNLIFGDAPFLSGLDIIAYPVILVLVTVSIYRSWKFEASFLGGVVSLLVVLGFLIVSTLNPALVGLAFGLGSSPVIWTLWPILNLLILYLLYADLFAKNEDS
jgi:CHAT domain